MKKLPFHIFDSRAKELFPRYLFQSLCAGLFIFAAFSMMQQIDRLLVITSLAASSFIAFTFPHSTSASPRCLIGSYTLAALWGCFYSWIGDLLSPAVDRFLQSDVIACALTIFFMSLMMALLDMEHPPAAAMAAFLVFSDAPLLPALAGIGFATLLWSVKWLLRKRLINL